MARLISRSRATVLATALVVAYASGLVAYLLAFLGPVHQAEQQALDWRFLYRGPVGEKSQEVVLVTIDEEANLPYWSPIPRDHLAAVIRSLSQGGARLIGVDFFLGKPTFDAVADSLLIEAIREAGNVVLVSYLDRDDADDLRENTPSADFLGPALDHGYATFFTDTGVESVREGTSAVGIGGKHALSLTGCLYAHSRGMDTGAIRDLDWSRRDRSLPGSGDDYRRTLDYTGPPFQVYRGLDHEMLGGIAAYQSHQVARFPAPIARRFFEGKIVLVGSGLSDAPDRYRTPFFSKSYGYAETFGVEIHAHLLNTLLSSQPLEHSGFFLSALLVLLPAFVAALLAVRLRPQAALPIAALIACLVWLFGFYLFNTSHLIIPVVMPTLSTGLGCLFGLAYLASTEGKQKDEVRDRFGPMVGETQLQEVLASPDAWTTDGEDRVVSVLWAQVTMPDATRAGLSGRESVAHYQACWESARAVIHKHNGAIFRYEEDGLGAVFGAPLDDPEHPVRAALACVDLLESWGSLRESSGFDNCTLAVGADSGIAQIGELATGERYTYRALGKPVDRARALAGRAAGVDEILITRELYDQTREYVDAASDDPGVEEPAYRITGRSDAPAIGAAERPADPFWKHLGLRRPDEDPIPEDFLDGLKLFSDLSRREIRRLRPILYPRTYNAGETVFSQGEVGSALYVVQSGSVDILQDDPGGGRPQLIQRLGAGDFFGELALLSDLPRPASAVAYEPSELIVLFQTDLYDLISREPELGMRLIRSLSRITGERLVHTYEELMHLKGTLAPDEGDQT